MIGSFTDQLNVNIIPNNLLIGKRTTARFTAVASGVSTNNHDFIYQWRKRGSHSILSDKVSGSNGEVLVIPNVLESDEGQYYCNVTNEWGRSVRSTDVTLSIYGMNFVSIILYSHYVIVVIMA